MIEYVAAQGEDSAPRIEKRFTASSGEIFSVSVSVRDTEETKQIPTEVVWQHLENLRLRIIEITGSTGFSIIQTDERIGMELYPLRRWAEITECFEAISSWWEIAYMAPEDEE